MKEPTDQYCQDGAGYQHRDTNTDKGLSVPFQSGETLRTDAKADAEYVKVEEDCLEDPRQFKRDVRGLHGPQTKQQTKDQGPGHNPQADREDLDSCEYEPCADNEKQEDERLRFQKLEYVSHRVSV
jgi:hypothetical protein